MESEMCWSPPKMTESKMCPLATGKDGFTYEYCSDKCGWYDSDRQQCAVLTLAAKIAEMERKTKKA